MRKQLLVTAAASDLSEQVKCAQVRRPQQLHEFHDPLIRRQLQVFSQ